MIAGYNSAEYFEQPILDRSGFREYDARWIIEPLGQNSDVGVNYVGARRLGLSLGRFLAHDLQAGKEIVVGHDFRRYSENVKNAVVVGLVQAGMSVIDIGLTTTPGTYFAQYAMKVPCVAVVTASHNENGWTGLKMGHRLSSTFGPDEMERFRNLTLGEQEPPAAAQGGTYRYVSGMREQYIDDLVDSWTGRFDGLPRFKVAVETGNGTAGLYLPAVLERLGFEVFPGNITPDWDFPHFNPNPESIPFLRAVEELVKSSRSEIGLCIDGDGDRLGVVSDKGQLVFSDKVGLLIAKHIEDSMESQAPFVIDVKSTSLFQTVLKTPIVWAKTGHSYVKAKVEEAGALAGFERSGHFFFRPPLGRGYDDACVAALATLWAVASARKGRPSVKISDLLAELPSSHASPNRQPFVSDETKYAAVGRIAAELESRPTFAGKEVIDVNKLNGIRITLADQSWLLVRASSNSPNLVIIAEVFDEDGAMLRSIDDELREVIDRSGADIGDFAPLYEF